jgi:hypothetical protein
VSKLKVKIKVKGEIGQGKLLGKLKELLDAGAVREQKCQ